MVRSVAQDFVRGVEPTVPDRRSIEFELLPGMLPAQRCWTFNDWLSVLVCIRLSSFEGHRQQACRCRGYGFRLDQLELEMAKTRTTSCGLRGGVTGESPRCEGPCHHARIQLLFYISRQ